MTKIVSFMVVLLRDLHPMLMENSALYSNERKIFSPELNVSLCKSGRGWGEIRWSELLLAVLPVFVTCLRTILSERCSFMLFQLSLVVSSAVRGSGRSLS